MGCSAAQTSSSSFSVGLGMTLDTRLVASSRSIPVGSPVFGSFTISPPGGLLVFFVMPAIFNAMELASPI